MQFDKIVTSILSESVDKPIPALDGQREMYVYYHCYFITGDRMELFTREFQFNFFDKLMADDLNIIYKGSDYQQAVDASLKASRSQSRYFIDNTYKLRPLVGTYTVIHTQRQERDDLGYIEDTFKHYFIFEVDTSKYNVATHASPDLLEF